MEIYRVDLCFSFFFSSKNEFLSRKREILYKFSRPGNFAAKKKLKFLFIFHKSIEKALDFSRIGMCYNECSVLLRRFQTWRKDYGTSISK